MKDVTEFEKQLCKVLDCLKVTGSLDYDKGVIH